MIPPELMVLSQYAAERFRQAQHDHQERIPPMTQRSVLRGLGAALRFSMIPILCAAVVALASEDPRGRLLALLAGLAALVLGLGVNAREILGRRTRRPRGTVRAPLTTGEWMARVR